MSYLSPLHQEHEVLRRIAQGDEKAFAALFDHYHQRLGIHIYRITKSTELAEEIVHDVFLKIWLNRELLGEIENFQAYLFVLSKNAALNGLKKLANEQARITELDADQLQIAETTEDDYRYLLIDEAIDRLPFQQRQVYLLSRHERLSYAEIAERMSLSRETVKKYLQLSTESISSYIRKRLVISVLLLIQIFF
ncbi:RNA polymerase sigma-70 factor (ECF subfamily) [Larkinella arboricola]|uniref:RNA polymerase sigma-70 factor (ECF subfamily) n=1 Tax=Larkinella arboricola TaxID=643671 RepID=A0A327X5B7_LARAB|nr:sigma-70 family RNA polymerase sigma factor [Larkinella arboricola]RAK02290.1 RNA polymerase sigma-70 factor (ECF subfamily) [Larkinella arboricola]